MTLNKKLILAGTALTTLFVAGIAMAQSTATQSIEENQEVVIKGTRGPKSINGLAVSQTVTKTRSSIDDKYIATQAAGQTILSTINLLPGVSFSNNDPTGTAGGDITLRGFDAQRVSLTLDGMPLNDTGNYQIYANQQVDPELLGRVDVNLGTTDVDSPTAAAAGGTINLISAKPDKAFGVELKGTVGDNAWDREFVRVDTGEFGPWNTSAYAAVSHNKSDVFVGTGQLEKTQYDAKVYQPLTNGDFVAAAIHWNKNRNNFISRETLAQFNSGSTAFLPSTTPCMTPWDNANNPTACPSTASTYYNYSINPSDTGNLRLQGKFHLADNLVLTVDPSYQYVMANGGGTTTVKESDKRLIGASTTATGVDLNGDGDTKDTVRIYAPSNTKTNRIAVLSSLIWSINDHSTLRVAYTLDHGRHRQTGEWSYLTADGELGDVFSSRKGSGSAKPVLAADGTQVQKRNRASVAKLEQFSLSYNGSFIDNALKVDIGIRAPKLTRELNNFCYQQNTFNAYCTTSPTAVADAGVTAGVPALAPISFTKTFSRVLPNLGASYKLSDNDTIYASYAETISAPRTDDLYDSKIPTIKPEVAKTIDLGWRYSSPVVSGTLAVWKSDFSHRIERAYDEELGFSTSTDIGDVKMQGVNAELGYRPLDNLSFYASYSATTSEILSDVPSGTTTFYATKGKKLNKYPKNAAAVRADYDLGPWSFGFQGKLTGQRYTTLMNTEIAPAYTLWDTDIRYSLGNMGPLKGTYVQVNVQNLFDQKYLSTISVSDVFSTSGQLFQPGYGRTASVTLRTKF